jgi:peroxiredoxin
MEQAAIKSRLKAGDWFPSIHAKTIHGWSLSVPNGAAPHLHLQFLRHAGSSVGNPHLRSFVRRDLEIRGAGITEVVIFHATKEALLPYRRSLPFEVIADPDEQLHERFGAGSSLATLLDPRAWPALQQAYVSRNMSDGNRNPNRGIRWLPAEFLIAESGRVKAAHYGKHVDDRWSVDEVLSLARSHHTIRYRFDSSNQQKDRNQNGGNNLSTSNQ